MKEDPDWFEERIDQFLKSNDSNKTIQISEDTKTFCYIKIFFFFAYKDNLKCSIKKNFLSYGDEESSLKLTSSV